MLSEILFPCVLGTEVAFLYLPDFFFFLTFLSIYLFYTVDLNIHHHHTLSRLRKKRTEVPLGRKCGRGALERSGATQDRRKSS